MTKQIVPELQSLLASYKNVPGVVLSHVWRVPRDLSGNRIKQIDLRRDALTASSTQIFGHTASAVPCIEQRFFVAVPLGNAYKIMSVGARILPRDAARRFKDGATQQLFRETLRPLQGNLFSENEMRAFFSARETDQELIGFAQATRLAITDTHHWSKLETAWTRLHNNKKSSPIAVVYRPGTMPLKGRRTRYESV